MTLLLLALFGTHLYFTFHTGFIQRRIPYAIYLSLQPHQKGGQSVSPFSALATALAATIGTGNIIGVSTAVAIGGPGAVFWCWLTGVLGIATCYAECCLSVRYHVAGEDGTWRGGPMYVLEKRLHQKSAAVLFAAAVIFVSLGMGSSIQAASIRTAVSRLSPRTAPQIVGAALAFLTGIVVLGGGKQIMKVCTWLVPFMSLFYFGGCLCLIWINREVLFQTLGVIIGSAFTSRSLLGGSVGTAVLVGMRTGIARGLFTNEAGMGSIPMAAASADAAQPERQALVSMTGPFWDTVVMCAITGIALVSCMVKENSFYQNIEGDRWCFKAFAQLPFAGEELLSVSLILFAFATIIGWNYYGTCAVRYLFSTRECAGEFHRMRGNAKESAGKFYCMCGNAKEPVRLFHHIRGDQKGILLYQVFYVAAVCCGTMMEMEQLWEMSDFLNLAMAVPNLISLWMLRKEVKLPENI